jgi:hypothetical protein
MAFPPVDNGGETLAVKVAFPERSAFSVGGSGIVYGVVLRLADGLELPAAFSTTIDTVYEFPLVNPVISYGPAPTTPKYEYETPLSSV